MSDNKTTPSKIDKKLLENPFVGSLVVPIAIVLVGALIIFGVTKMISSEHSYKDLVREMKSKTFGNKWVAALELSKIISANKIPPEDIPWLIKSMDEIYSTTIDHRTRDFVVVAVGALRDERASKILVKAIADKNKDVRFHAVVALANLPKSVIIDWAPVIELLKSEDYAMVQAATLTLATHNVRRAEKEIAKLVESEHGYGVRYAAATALVQYQNEKSLNTVKEILMLNDKSLGAKMTVEDIRGLKFNVLNAAQKAEWKVVAPLIETMLQSEKDLKVVERARAVLKLLKK